jgi:hypothetical protein
LLSEEILPRSSVFQKSPKSYEPPLSPKSASFEYKKIRHQLWFIATNIQPPAIADSSPYFNPQMQQRSTHFRLRNSSLKSKKIITHAHPGEIRSNESILLLGGAIGAYLAREAARDEPLHVVVDGQPPALRVRIWLDARDQLRREALRDRPALGVEAPRKPGGRIGMEPVGHHPHPRRQTVAPSAWRSQNPGSPPRAAAPRRTANALQRRRVAQSTEPPRSARARIET